MNKKKIGFLLWTLVSLLSYFFTDIPLHTVLIISLLLGAALLLFWPLIGADTFSLDRLVEKGADKRQEKELEAVGKAMSKRLGEKKELDSTPSGEKI